jgi:hypothetical protein
VVSLKNSNKSKDKMVGITLADEQAGTRFMNAEVDGDGGFRR